MNFLRLSVPVVLTAILTNCSKPPAAPSPSAAAQTRPLAIRTAVAAEQPVPGFLRLTGELTSSQDASVAADTAGRVEDTPVERGSAVKAGDVLVKLEHLTLSLALAEADADLALAKSKLDLAESEFKRHEPLARSRAIAETDFARIRADRDGQAAGYAAAQARRDRAVKAMEDATVKAPFDGTVVERFVARGEYVKADSTVVRLVDLANLRLLAYVPEPDVGKVSAGQAADFTVAAFPGEIFRGTVRFVGAAVRTDSRDLPVEIEVEDSGGRLRPGLFAEARLLLPDHPAVTVPAAALRKDGAQRRVWVVEKDKLSERLVETGETKNDLIEIRRGVRKGEAVMLSPGTEAADGLPVTAAQS